MMCYNRLGSNYLYMSKNIAILCGGNSSEFEISIKTADQIIKSLKNNE